MNSYYSQWNDLHESDCNEQDENEDYLIDSFDENEDENED